MRPPYKTLSGAAFLRVSVGIPVHLRRRARLDCGVPHDACSAQMHDFNASCDEGCSSLTAAADRATVNVPTNRISWPCVSIYGDEHNNR